ncbi:Membrane protein involved in the export of O-antigen and teichoic acid [Pseudomonas sp. ok272]|uniref:lipopolysaccharide biosynthesis protein n=1 Tax=unclassified Pseudomonas TaxID=196821 RepID=UPI0008BB71C9|nr:MULTISPECIES: oligosaccharide flippase family protein [unclassified Pseudomonas]SEM87211.1 Membrane protein involved in the export of O-antigen and teichoic acid [Pseudomonas sp. ok272]SFM76707.1 Membrane protein involved in the export of O-antigen and teichoic acid [Pseudomonas sp. ok602]
MSGSHSWAQLSRRGHGVFWVIGGQAAQSLASFLTGLVLGRCVSQEALGAYALGLSFCFLIISLGDTLIATPYTYLRASREGEPHTLFASALWGSAALGLVVALVLTVLHLMGAGLPAELWPALPLAVMGLVMREFLRRHFYVINRSGHAMVLDLTSAAGQLLALGVLAWGGWLSAASVFWAIAGVSALSFALNLGKAQASFFWPPLRMLATQWRAFLGYGGWLVAGGLCHVASVQLYPWLALLGGGQAMVGLYAACIAVTNLINPLLIALTNHFRPRFIAHYQEAGQEGFMRYLLLRSLPFLLPALAFVMLAGWAGGPLLGVLYGKEFSVGAPALVYLAFGLMAVAAAAPIQLGLLALRAPVSNLFYHGTNLGVLVVLALIWHDRLSLQLLAQFYCGANVAGLLMLGILFQVSAKKTNRVTGEMPASD